MDNSDSMQDQKNKYIDKDNYLLNRNKNKNENKIIFNIILVTLFVVYFAITIRVIYIFNKPPKPPYIIIVLYVIISILFYYIYYNISHIVSIIIEKNILFKI